MGKLTSRIGKGSGSKLDQPRCPVALVLRKTFDVSSTVESGWLINGKKVILVPFKLNYAKKDNAFKITIPELGLSYERIHICPVGR